MAKTSTEETPVLFGDSSIVADSSASTTTATKKNAQAKNLIPTTTIDTGVVPQTDTSAFAYKVRHIMNGDIKDGSISLVAKKMVEEAHAFQLQKPVINSFPATGAEYLKTLDFKVGEDSSAA